MIIPWGTDAPIYHRPIATIGLIVVNVLAFFLFPYQLHDDWTLVLGDGVHPLQWVTNIFMHASFFQLASNMLFLWTFGLVVEGKLGWWAFLLVYLGLGAFESAGMQLLVRSATPIHMLGSSGVIFGLLAMCLAWAPMNEVVCIIWLRFTPSVFDVSILWFAAGYIALDVVMSSFTGALMASILDRSTGAILAAVLDHTSGAILGFVLALVLLRLEWVDCENWDIFAVLEGRKGQSKAAAKKAKSRSVLVSAEYRRKRGEKRKGKAKKTEARVASVEDAAAAALRTMRLHLELREFEAALSVYHKSKRSVAGFQPAESDWLALIQAVLDQQAWNDSVSVMRDYVERTAEPSARVRLKLGQVLIQKLARPLQGLKILSQIASGTLPASLEATRRKLVHEAEQMREDGELELQDEMW
jgi:membrane associated rhomboid family serine protease